MAAIPVRNEAVETTPHEQGAVHLTYPLAHRPWALKVANYLKRPVPGPTSKTLELDELGAWTWKHIDGKRNVAELSELFATTWRMHPREAELSITTFLKELGKRGLVLMVSPQAK